MSMENDKAMRRGIIADLRMLVLIHSLFSAKNTTQHSAKWLHMLDL
jgi:hypothetical protein